MTQGILFFFTFIFTIFPPLPAIPILPDPDPATVQTLHRSPPATIPAFPEQSEASACPLDLPEDLFHGVRSACASKQLHRSRCCPVLAAWLYAAYSKTALQPAPAQTASYDMPVLPDDSETCVGTLEKALGGRGIELRRPNETCDVVFCYCGIRLHPLTCPEAFAVDARGKLVGGEAVRGLERDCAGGGGIGGCSHCLTALYSLNGDRAGRSNRSERTSEMHNRDCQLMGLTWLLNKDRSAYIHTVSAVLRALMMNEDDASDPTFCSLNTDGMPLAVDSSEINDQSSSTMLSICLHHFLLPLSLLYMSILFLVTCY